MFCRIVSTIVVIVLLAAFNTAFAMNKTDKSSKTVPGLTGTVTAVKGSTVTVRDIKGAQRQFVLDSAAGIKVGQSAWCEEDCGKGMKIGDRNVRVRNAGR